MALKKIIADNLRSLCDGYDGSIAQLSRKIGITPQQFNNYLSAKHIPNETVVAKICNLLDVNEDELYVSRRIRSKIQSTTTSDLLQNATAALERWKLEEKPNLNPGLYSTYFVTAEQPNSILRSTMVVDLLDGILTFRRFTSISRSARAGSGSRRSDHHGIVVQQRNSTFYFMAVNERPNHEPSLITTQWASSKTPLLSGYAVVETARGFAVSVVVIAPEIERTLRQSLELMQYYTWDDRAVAKSVKSELEHLVLTLNFQTH